MRLAVLIAALCIAGPAAAQAYDPVAMVAAQKEAMKAFAFMDGVWRGPAWTILPSGRKHEIIQTERIGPFLGGAVKVIEGRSYEPDGSPSNFNAFGIISPDRKGGYSMRSYAQGNIGDFPITPTGSGYTWEIPAGPATIRYSATVKDGVLREVGHRIMPGAEPVQIFEMNLTRVGDSDWPTGTPVPPR